MPSSRHIALLGTCRSGLGHLRRIINIAQHLHRKDQSLQLTLFTNAQPEGLTGDDLAVLSAVEICDRSEMADRLSRSTADLAVLDTLRIPGIGACRQRAVLILRETPEPGLGDFRRDDGRPWDCIIVPNAKDHWMPKLDNGFARRFEAAGWIMRPTGVRRPADRSAGIVVATGGGGTTVTRALLYPMLERVISGAREKSRRGLRVRQALGPRSGGEALRGVDEVFDPGGELNAVFRSADLVISTAGYNSVLELASTDTPAMLAAIPRSLDDQLARVRLWGPRLGFGLTPGNVEVAADWLAGQVDHPRRRKPVDLGPDGAMRAANTILEML